MSIDPMYKEETCWECNGDGDVLDGDECDECTACAGTGLVYTQRAIQLQVEAEEAQRLARAKGAA